MRAASVAARCNLACYGLNRSGATAIAIQALHLN